MPSKKRRRQQEPPATHPRNRYAEKPPDFALLASLYPSFQPFVFLSRAGRPALDWTDFGATRELTRVLLHHDHGVHWWIPDGQLCPTVPNRSNYIHWIEDLLASDVIPRRDRGSDGTVRGFDIGTGANCIYPLLGASLCGWSFVGSDVTDVALEWARKNVESNPHLSHLIEIRNADAELCSGEAGVRSEENVDVRDVQLEHLTGETAGVCIEENADVGDVRPEHLVGEAARLDSVEHYYRGPPILVGVVRDGEEFDFCMCNPPFFESIEEAGLNPKTSCGGTHQEMVCPGGERAFITRIIEDSMALKHHFRWFTSMIGRKTNLKFLVSKLREVGVSIVKTTEFVQGQTARWGLAWSFMPPNRKSIKLHASEKNNYTFMLEGLKRQNSAVQILKAVELFFLACGASCKLDVSNFSVTATLSNQQIVALVNKDLCDSDLASNGSTSIQGRSNELCFRISVFEQIPGTLLVKGSLLHKESPLSGRFSLILQHLEEAFRKEFVGKFHGPHDK